MNAAQDRRPEPDFCYFLRGKITPEMTATISHNRRPCLVFTRLGTFFAAAIVLIGLSCSVEHYQHDASDAGKTALRFAELAFVQRDFKSAYELVTHDKPGSVSEEQLANLVKGTHPNNDYPTKLSLDEYEVHPGTPIIHIFLSGVYGDKKTYYLIVTEGQKRVGYKVTELYRSDNPFPSTSVPRKRFE
jgi:hypothetical protein